MFKMIIIPVKNNIAISLACLSLISRIIHNMLMYLTQLKKLFKCWQLYFNASNSTNVAW